MHIFAGVIFHHVANIFFVHCLGQGIPCAQILPLTSKPHHLNMSFLLHHGIIKADFLQAGISGKQIMIIRKIHQLMSLVQQIPQLKGKNTAIPQSSLLDILPGRCLIRLFLEGAHLADFTAICRNNIAVFFTWISRLNAHQHQVRLILIHLLAKPAQSRKILILHQRVNRTDHHRLVNINMLNISQIGCRQGNSRKGIPAARLHRNPHLLPQLIEDRRNLGPGSGYRHIRLRQHGLNLPVHLLHHRLILSRFSFKNLDKLLGADIVGQRPQPFPRTSRK